jgi:hypothetical protein
MRKLTFIITALLAAPAPALAGEETALLFDAVTLLPKDGVHAGASGLGAELRFVGEDCMTGGFTAFAAIGAPGTENRRDVLDFGFTVGIRPERSSLAPFAAVSLDVLHITTHAPEMTYRGTTLGIGAHVGVLGRVGDKLFVKASGGFLGAIVPGTGDDLGGWLLSGGVGWMIDD